MYLQIRIDFMLLEENHMCSWLLIHTWATLSSQLLDLCRYSRLVLTTSNQKSGVVLHGTVSFPHARNSVRNQKLYVGSWYCTLAQNHNSVFTEVFLSFPPWLNCLEIVFVSWFWVWVTILLGCLFMSKRGITIGITALITTQWPPITYWCWLVKTAAVILGEWKEQALCTGRCIRGYCSIEEEGDHTSNGTVQGKDKRFKITQYRNA